jgi:hypothetical protein
MLCAGDVDVGDCSTRRAAHEMDGVGTVTETTEEPGIMARPLTADATCLQVPFGAV